MAAVFSLNQYFRNYVAALATAVKKWFLKLKKVTQLQVKSRAFEVYQDPLVLYTKS